MVLHVMEHGIRLTEDGVSPVDLSCPSAREVLQGPVGPAYLKEGVVVTTDGASSMTAPWVRPLLPWATGSQLAV